MDIETIVGRVSRSHLAITSPRPGLLTVQVLDKNSVLKAEARVGVNADKYQIGDIMQYTQDASTQKYHAAVDTILRCLSHERAMKLAGVRPEN
jgi:hypothetical protein